MKTGMAGNPDFCEDAMAALIKRYRARRFRRGFSLFGVLLGLGLAAVVIVGAVGTYNAAREAANRSEALVLLNRVRANIETAFAGAPSYGNNADLVASLDRRGGIPDSARTIGKGKKVEIRHPFGGLVTVTGGPGGISNRFRIQFADVDNEICASLGDAYAGAQPGPGRGDLDHDQRRRSHLARHGSPDHRRLRRRRRRQRYRVHLRMTRVRKHTCGAGALLGVLLLAAFAGTALTLHYEARGIVRGQALDRAAGRVFAAWFQAAHRASQDQAAAFAQTLKDGNAIILTPARLRALGTAPPGLPDAPGRNATFSLGVIADGTPRGVPMAFGVLEPSLDGGAAHGVAIREGALGAGLAGLESVGGGALMAPHLPAIEAALGRSLGPGRTLLSRAITGFDIWSRRFTGARSPAGRI